MQVQRWAEATAVTANCLDFDTGRPLVDRQIDRMGKFSLMPPLVFTLRMLSLGVVVTAVNERARLESVASDHVADDGLRMRCSVVDDLLAMTHLLTLAGGIN